MNSVMDYGLSLEYTPCSNCKRISKILDFGLTDEQNVESAAILNKHLEKLRDLPIETRQLLGIMVMRSYQDRDACVVPIHEIEKVTGLRQEDMIQNVEILGRRGIASDIEMENNIPICILWKDSETSWPYWNDIREFVKATEIPIKRICCDLDFSVFDE